MAWPIYPIPNVAFPLNVPLFVLVRSLALPFNDQYESAFEFGGFELG